MNRRQCSEHPYNLKRIAERLALRSPVGFHITWDDLAVEAFVV